MWSGTSTVIFTTGLKTVCHPIQGENPNPQTDCAASDALRAVPPFHLPHRRTGKETVMSEKKSLKVYTIVDRGDGKKDLWLRIGTAFINKDASLNVVLNALPIDGKLHIREEQDAPERPRDERAKR
jgi:hypothetical protein